MAQFEQKSWGFHPTKLALSALFCVILPQSGLSQPPGQVNSASPLVQDETGVSPSHRLEWSREVGAEACLAASMALSMLSELQQSVAWAQPESAETNQATPPATRVRVVLAKDLNGTSPRWSAEVTLELPGEPRVHRRFSDQGRDCSGLVSRVLLGISLMVSPRAPMAEVGGPEAVSEQPSGANPASALSSPREASVPPSNGSTPSPLERLTLEAQTPLRITKAERSRYAMVQEPVDRARGSLQFATESGIVVGPVGTIPAFFEVSLRWRWLAAAAWITTPANSRDNPSPAPVEVWMWGGSLALCPWTPQYSWGWLSLCGSADAGVLSGASPRVPDGATLVFYLASRLRFSGAFAVSGPVSLIGSIAAGPVWVRPRFDALDPDGSRSALFTSSPWVGTVSAGISLAL